MTGKQHMIIGTTASMIMGAYLVSNNLIDNPLPIINLVSGSIVGSYMPDIDSDQSKASQTFNKIITSLIIIFTVTYITGQILFVKNIIDWLHINVKNLTGIILFSIISLLGKLSPHRMFTHKILGTFLFCLSIHLIENTYFTYGFIMGYLLHIVCDRFTKKGKYLNFFELKLPCKTSKNKIHIRW